MKGAAKRNDLVFRFATGAGPPASELEGPLVRFRPRVAKERLRRERLLDQRRSKLLAGRCRIQVRRMDQSVRGGVQGRAQAGIPIAKRMDGNSADELELSFAIG